MCINHLWRTLQIIQYTANNPQPFISMPKMASFTKSDMPAGEELQTRLRKKSQLQSARSNRHKVQILGISTYTDASLVSVHARKQEDIRTQHKELDSSDHDQNHNEDWHAFLHETRNHNHDHSNGYNGHHDHGGHSGHMESYSGHFDLSVSSRRENHHTLIPKYIVFMANGY